MKKGRYSKCVALLFAYGLTELFSTVRGQSAIANYPLDGTAVDVGGNGLNGVVIGASPTTNRFGAPSSALSFDGVGNLVNCGNPSALNSSTNFTISAWVKLKGLQSAKYIVAKYSGASSPFSYGLATEYGTARAYAFVSTSTGTYVECSGGSSLNDAKWHLLDFVYDNATGIRLYVDGSLVGSQAAAGYGPFTNSTIPLTIGGLLGGQFFGGNIDDVKIYNRALSNGEIQSRFQAEADGVVAIYKLNGDGNDSSGNGLNGTVFGAVSAPDRFGIANSALSFNGVTDYIDLGNRPEFNFARNFTILAWVKLNGNQPAEYILAKYADFGGGNRSPRSYGLATDGSSRAYGFVSNDNPGYSEVSGGVSMSDGAWHSVGLSYDNAGGLKLYQDGALVSSQSVAGFPAFTNAVSLMIGRASTGQFFDGAIDDVRIYMRTLTDLEFNRRFRTDLGAIVAIAPAVKLQFSTIPGRTYQLQSSVDLTTWLPVGDAFLASTNTASTYADAAMNEFYFRLLVP